MRVKAPVPTKTKYRPSSGILVPGLAGPYQNTNRYGVRLVMGQWYFVGSLPTKQSIFHQCVVYYHYVVIIGRRPVKQLPHDRAHHLLRQVRDL